MVESIPEKDQFLIAYPNYVLRETVTYPNGGVSHFYDDGVDMVIIDDEICSCRDGEQIFPYTLITDKQNHYMKIYRRVFRFLGFDPETIEKCLQKNRQEVLHFTKKISERGEHADSSPLELLFEQNFTDVYGMRALKYLQKEFRISDEEGNNYFLDYLVDTADSRVAIEENGIHYHHPQLIGIEGYRKQLRKQNTCALWGLKLYRFSTEDCRFKDRIEDDIRSYLGKDTGGFREAGLLLERKTELYEHQEISLAQIEERREKGIRAFLIVLPTAAGKSRIVEEDIMKFAAGKEQFRALILAPNTNIIADWKERIDKDLQPLQDRIDIKTYSYAVRHYHEKPRDYYSYIVVDEAHHSPANTYQKVMEYFKPKLFLGMTATPDKRDDGEASKNVYELFHYQIAYEIRLQQAMEEDLLCPFHYFGISDISVVTDEQMKTRNISEENFGKLTSDERVRHVIEQAKYYGYSGDRVKGLVFCSRNRECEELSAKFNALGYRTIALSGDNKDKEREKAFERLAMNEEDATDEMQPLDYIFSVDILNEGVDIVEVNQVIMLRPTQSPIVFIQQLGRGLRKAENKEYVVILDFIGNYNNNFMIPVALSGDRTYNADTIRKYVISGNNTIPGASTVHFDEIAKEKIFNSIDKIKGMRSIIKESYISLKNRIGRTPLLFDFYEQGEIDPLVIIREYKTYWQFLEAVEKGKYFSKLTDHEKLILDYLSKTILSGVRPSELFLLQKLLTKKTFSVNEVQKELKRLLDYNITDLEMRESVKILQGCFTSKDEEYQKYKTIEIMDYDEEQGVRCFASYANCLLDNEFNTQVKDIINVGLARYRDKYAHGKVEQTPFVLYEKYSRRDVSLLMNCGKDMSSTMYGMSRIGDDVFIFITYHKEEAEEGKNYADGKPDYADAFEDNLIFKWDSQIGKDNSSPYMQKVLTAPRKHLLVKKSDAESSFYYMGQFDIIESVDSQKEDNSGKMKPIAKVTMKMHHPVREDLLRYLQSNISKENKAV